MGVGCAFKFRKNTAYSTTMRTCMRSSPNILYIHTPTFSRSLFSVLGSIERQRTTKSERKAHHFLSHGQETCAHVCVVQKANKIDKVQRKYIFTFAFFRSLSSNRTGNGKKRTRDTDTNLNRSVRTCMRNKILCWQ